MCSHPVARGESRAIGYLNHKPNMFYLYYLEFDTFELKIFPENGLKNVENQVNNMEMEMEVEVV